MLEKTAYVLALSCLPLPDDCPRRNDLRQSAVDLVRLTQRVGELDTVGTLMAGFLDRVKQLDG
jgi:hypothetical protein